MCDGTCCYKRQVERLLALSLADPKNKGNAIMSIIKRYVTLPSGEKMELGMCARNYPELYSPCVYIVSSQGLYKIGRTSQLAKRMSSLSRSVGVPVNLVHVVYDGVNGEVECALHSMFSNKRVMGEWFDLSRDDIEKIKSMSSVEIRIAGGR